MDTRESIKLKSIVLNNIRRFGSDVEIKFGAGATILIAPNGSGRQLYWKLLNWRSHPVLSGWLGGGRR